MKIIPATLALGLLTAAAAQAQTSQGTTYLRINAGNISYTQRAEDNFRSISGALLPAAGHFITTNFLVGAEVPLGYSHYRYEYVFSGTIGSDEKFSASDVTFGVSPFVRYYLPGTGSHRFFGQISGGLGWLRNRQQNTYSGRYKTRRERTIDYQEYGAGLGYNYFITPSAALELTAGYKRSTLGPDRTNGNLDVQAGFALLLPSIK
ncbi:outer membrane beta-barrel protein [Hymenobacter metallilatus]|uniref:Outer membrane protein beta-barrel domain-containing protein n=1 Tax=Hymenobacter metallilatus TaxID=2493666 RepID=A0A428JFN4_9BACT|nr:outer membrane beta-barrel protein [Hymenobacter metallilatus]RSK31078.1 hypothetical protein EI290_13740 [Hymenobacter metallilatus]